MKQKRVKAYKKQINVYVRTFKFREPFQTVIDDRIILDCNKASYDLVKGLKRTVQGELKPMITQCCMQKLYESKNSGAINLAKLFERRRCNHSPSDPLEPSQCIKSIVDIEGENKFRYVVATQDPDLRKHLRMVPGVPLIYMKRSVMVMEPMSSSSAQYASDFENQKLKAMLNDSEAGKVHKNEESNDARPLKKRKGPKEPNPLSVKKKKSEPESFGSQTSQKRRRRHHKSNKISDEAVNQQNTSVETEINANKDNLNENSS